MLHLSRKADGRIGHRWHMGLMSGPWHAQGRREALAAEKPEEEAATEA